MFFKGVEMRYSLYFMLLLSIILSIYEAVSEYSGHIIYIIMVLTASATLFTIKKANKQLIITDYYGVGQLGWEESTRKERKEYMLAHTAFEIREILTAMLMSGSKQQTRIKWMLYKLDQKFE